MKEKKSIGIFLFVFILCAIWFVPMALGDDSAPVPTAGVWKGKGIQFNVSDDGKYITNSESMLQNGASIIITLEKHAGNAYMVTVHEISILIPIIDGKFQKDFGAFEVKGEFVSANKATGTIVGQWQDGDPLSVNWSAVPDPTAIVPERHTLVEAVKANPPIREFRGHMESVYDLALTPDGKKLLSSSADSSIILWDIQSGNIIKKLEGHTKPVNEVIVTPDGESAISCSDDKSIDIWNLSTGKLLKTLIGHSEGVFCIAVTPDGKRLVSGGADSKIKIWDLETGTVKKQLWEGNRGAVRTLLISPDGKRLITAAHGDALTLWDMETGRIENTIAFYPSLNIVNCLTADGKFLVSAEHEKIMLWDIELGKCIRIYQGHDGNVMALTLTPDGTKIISGAGDSTIRIWDLQTGTEIRKIPIASNVECVITTKDGKQIIAAFGDGVIRFWNIE
ncbi:MAG TPA: WD40 repeat domain-containing protein [Bacillota bacterium]|nr:WD40 repeat domain-containing protein [Bacillota bacterium]